MVIMGSSIARGRVRVFSLAWEHPSQEKDPGNEVEPYPNISQTLMIRLIKVPAYTIILSLAYSQQ